MDTNDISIPKSVQPKCSNCSYAETNDIVYGTVHCMYDPSGPIAHSSDHVCMQYKHDDEENNNLQ